MRARVCRDCGRKFEVETGRDLYLCPDCAKRARSESVIRERTCKSCGKPFVGYPRSFFCPACSAERKRQQKKMYSQRKPSRPLGSVDTCENCGKQYIVNSGRQRYCSECAEKKVQENIRTHKREYMAENKEKIQKIKSESRGKRYVCAICGKEFEKHTPAVTCSLECEKELKRRRQNRADIKRGKRKIPEDWRYDSGLPKSGIIGVTYHKQSGKWQATKKGKYVGLYDTAEQAADALMDDNKK